MNIEKIEDYPLSDEDVRIILGRDVSIVLYPDLANMESIDECFDSKGRCVLLFLTSSPTSGHWCCLLKKKDGIHFFDPYGEAPEEQKEGASPALLEQMNERQPHLVHLLKASGRPVFYNTHDFQKEDSHVNTCGRWCVVRCMHKGKSIEQFKQMVDDSGMHPDAFVSVVTYKKLGK